MDRLLATMTGRRICYYPSAGRDYSDILYVRPENFQTGTKNKYELPDLYLHTGYYPWENKLTFQPGQILHDAPDGKITVKTVEELETLDMWLSSLVDFPQETAEYGKCFLMDVEVYFKNGNKPEQTSLLYCFAENEGFTARILYKISQRENIEFTYVCLVGYGSEYGGAKSSGSWLTATLERLKTKCFITDSDLEWNRGDYEASDCYGHLRGRPAVTDQTPSRNLEQWASRNPVRWMEV